jgi:hypothetical protein
MTWVLAHLSIIRNIPTPLEEWRALEIVGDFSFMLSPVEAFIGFFTLVSKLSRSPELSDQ